MEGGGALGESSGSEQDYLQDPELWEDTLPQPYRMIQHIIDVLLEDTWGYIEHLEVCRQQEAAQVQVPSTKGELWCEEVLTQSHGGVHGGRGVVFVGNSRSIFVLRCDLESTGDEVIAEQNLQQDVISLEVVQKGDIHFVLVQHTTG
jgi:hypothetical protein